MACPTAAHWSERVVVLSNPLFPLVWLMVVWASGWGVGVGVVVGVGVLVGVLVGEGVSVCVGVDIVVDDSDVVRIGTGVGVVVGVLVGVRLGVGVGVLLGVGVGVVYGSLMEYIAVAGALSWLSLEVIALTVTEGVCVTTNGPL